jgi:amino acid adenylation domain-containing protein
MVRPADAMPEPRLEAPCSRAQRRFWVLDQLDPGNPALNIAVRWRLEGDMPVASVEHTFRLIIARHETLRTYFEQINGDPVQIVASRVSFNVPLVDLTSSTEQQALAESERIARIEARTSFDLSVPPLIRVTLLRVRKDLSFLLVTVHHTVCDGWSIGILAREFGKICASIGVGRFSALPELPVSYGEFAAWQNEQLSGSEWQAAIDYWASNLRGLSYFELRADRPRPPVPTIKSDIQSVLLARPLTDGIEELANRNGCTMFMTVLAALFSLLHRYTGDTDIAIGTQVAGRDEVELENLVGVFINTVILRCGVHEDPTFIELMQRVSDTVVNAFEHQRVPLETLIEILKPKRELNRNPLFSINFIYQRSFIENATYGRFKLVDVPSYTAGALYDLNFFMVERPEGWRISCEYKTDLFETSTITRCLEHLQNVLGAVVIDSARRISELPVIGSAERNLLLVDFNRTEARFPSHLTLPEMFAAQAAKTPDATALVFAGRTLSYSQLDARSNQLAHYLRKLGVEPETLVAICADRSLELIVGLQGILKAGGAYVPLDPQYPQDRLAFMMRDCGARVLLTQEALSRALPSEGAQVVCLDRDWHLIEQCPSSPPPVTARPDNLAYVIYTSGSTGRPKGAMNTHRAIVNRLAWMQDSYQLGADDRVLQKTPISFDVSVWELFWPLLYGAQMILARPGGHQDPSYLAEAIERFGVTIMHFVPSMLSVFLQQADLTRCRSLRDTFCSGEALSVDTQNEFLRALPSRLHNLYGPTEAAVDVTAWKCERLDSLASVPIGRPISNIRLYILDGHGQPTPLGVAGELYIGGVGVARGYLNRPELSKEKFLDSPFVAGERLYRTGDLSRYRADGNIEFLGRLDHQVKLRGLRIELGEIEATLREQPGIRDAVVLVREFAAGDQRLVAYFVADGADTGSTAALRSSLAARLPDYMVPSALVRLDVLPLTPNGKLDRASLPQPALEAAADSAVQAFDEFESRLAPIWSEVLKCGKISASANFFELGGHSLLAAQLLVKIEAEFGRRLTLASMFKCPTIAEQAALLRRQDVREFDFRRVIKLQPNGSRTPIIAIHNTGIFFGLCKRFGPDQPFTCLQLFDPALLDEPLPETIEEIASGYVQLIQRVHPTGPYIFVGWCVAGTLAFEVARQMQASRNETAVLLMIDTWAPSYLKRLRGFRAFLADYAYRIKLIALDWSAVRSGSQSLMGFLMKRIIVKRTTRLVRRLFSDEKSPNSGNAPLLTNEMYDQRLLCHLEKALKRYDPKPAQLKVTIYRSSKEPRGLFLDYDMGWKDLAKGGVDTTLIEGDHYTMFQSPGVDRMSEDIAARINALCAQRK